MPPRNRGHGPAHASERIPDPLRGRVAEIVAVSDAVAAAHLDGEGGEYAALARRMAAALARKRPSPLVRGDARAWAAGILHAVGWVNFLADPSRTPHLPPGDLAAAAGVGQSTMAARSRTIRELLDLVQLDPAWTRPSQLAENPLAWMILVDGIVVDARAAPPEIQREALRQGVIPFLPGGEPPDPREVSVAPEEPPEADDLPGREVPGGVVPPALWAEIEDELGRTLARNPDATIEDIDATLAALSANYNRRPQAELGGLSPAAVQRLLDADWDRPTSAVRLDESVSLADLESAAVLHDARLVLDLLADGGPVKATPKGNLPRAVVTAFRARMRQAADPWLTDPEGPKVLNEEDLMPLHVVRVLLELAGLVKRRAGTFSLTRRGEELRAAARAGALFARLLRTHFRALNLAYLDRVGPAPGFQATVAFTLYQFGRVGGVWRQPSALTEPLLLPAVREEAATDLRYDRAALMLETRVLRPLEGFGLAEGQAVPRRPGEVIQRRAYRKAPLFDRVMSFNLGTVA